MNRRILKKLCKKAAHVFHGKEFEKSHDNETAYARHGMPKREVRHGFIKDGLLDGTLLSWYRSSYEYEEYDFKLAWDLLVDAYADSHTDWSCVGGPNASLSQARYFGQKPTPIAVFGWAKGKNMASFI